MHISQRVKIIIILGIDFRTLFKKENFFKEEEYNCTMFCLILYLNKKKYYYEFQKIDSLTKITKNSLFRYLNNGNYKKM